MQIIEKSTNYDAVIVGSGAGGGMAAKMSDQERAMLEQVEREGWLKVADTLGYDEIIDPRDLRNQLLAGLKLSRGRLSEAPKPKV